MQGRGGNKFHFENNYVTKLTASLREAEFMKAFPLAFIPVLETQPLKMPRWHDAELLEQREALTTGLKLLKKYVWTKPANKKPEWKLLLSQHLHGTYQLYTFAFPEKLIDVTLDSLTSDACCAIHGDPTAANILKDNIVKHYPRRWRWIDPLDRPYIPNDPHVDLGKMFQSCWGYERILVDETFKGNFNYELAFELTTLTTLNYKRAWLWHIIHLIRLLPYQDRRVRRRFERILSVHFRP